MKLIVVSFSCLWGFSTLFPRFTASAESYPVPTPTTLVGALAKPYLKLIGDDSELYLDEKSGTIVSSAARLLDKVKYVTAGIKGFSVPFQDLEYISKVLYEQEGNLRSNVRNFLSYAFSALARGKTSLLTYSEEGLRGEVYAIYAVTDDDAGLLGKAAWGITRVGSKESAVYVKNVHIVEPEIVTDRKVETMFYIPVGYGVEAVESYTWVDMPVLKKENFAKGGRARSLESFFVPFNTFYGGFMTVRVPRYSQYVYSIKLSKEELLVVIPTLFDEAGRGVSP